MLNANEALFGPTSGSHCQVINLASQQPLAAIDFELEMVG